MTAKNSKKQDFEKEHAKIASGNKQQFARQAGQQWSVAGDFFTKFSLYKENQSGPTSADTSYTARP